MPKEYEKPIIDWADEQRENLKATLDKLQAGEDVRELELVSKKIDLFIDK